jgi:hypothetical protein
MMTLPERPSVSAASKLAFTFACWGLLLAPFFAIPAVVFGHIGRRKDKASSSSSRTAVVALFMGYFEVTMLAVMFYLTWRFIFR